MDRLVCEGGVGELNAVLFQQELVYELHLTICPVIFGGRTAPTLAGGEGIKHLADAAQFKMCSMKRVGQEMFLVYKKNNNSA